MDAETIAYTHSQQTQQKHGSDLKYTCADQKQTAKAHSVGSHDFSITNMSPKLSIYEYKVSISTRAQASISSG